MGNQQTTDNDINIVEKNDQSAFDDDDNDLINDDDDDDDATPWFKATTDFQTGETNLEPVGEEDHSDIAYIFHRLYSSHSYKHARPPVNKNLLPDRFENLLQNDLTHLLSNHVLIPNLNVFDACMGECESLQKDIHHLSISLRAAFKNPRISLLHRICRDITHNSLKNNAIVKYINLEETIIYGTTALIVIPLLITESTAKSEQNESNRESLGRLNSAVGNRSKSRRKSKSKGGSIGDGISFTAKCMSTAGTRSIKRVVYNMYDVIDSCRMHEYSKAAKTLERSYDIQPSKRKMGLKNDEDNNETDDSIRGSTLSTNGTIIITSTTRRQLTVIMNKDEEKSVNAASQVFKEVRKENPRKYDINELGAEFGRGLVVQYDDLVLNDSDGDGLLSTADVIIVPLTKKCGISKIFNLIRKCRRIIFVEVELGAIHSMITSDIVDDDNVKVFQKEKKL
jgi:hypothetical protein